MCVLSITSCGYYLLWAFMAVMGSTKYLAHAFKCPGLCAGNVGGEILILLLG